jgi:hypothetical protein
MDNFDEDGPMLGCWKRIAIGMVMVGVAPLPGQVAKPEATTKPAKMVLVELFTSEGCSSCPPADALLRKINGTQTSAGQLVVGISEHVTYWNSLGWSDPFSSQVYTDRQNAYGVKLGLESVYTPQLVINGAAQVVGSDFAAVTRAIAKENERPSRVSVQILSVSVAGSVLTAKFSAVGEAPAQGGDVVAVVVDDADQTSVLRGENSGRTISHVSVARSIARVAKLQAGEQTVQIPLPSGFRAAQGHHLILFAQTAGNGRVLGVDTKPL